MNKASLFRVCELDLMIRGNRCPNRKTAAQHFAISEKTIQRDIGFLKDMGAPIEFDPDRGFYYKEESFVLPFFRIPDRYLTALLVARHLLEQSQVKQLAIEIDALLATVGKPIKDKISAVDWSVPSMFSTRSAPAMPVDSVVMSAVIEALREHRVLKVMYKKRGAAAARKYQLCPCHLVNLEGDWYLLAARRDPLLPPGEEITKQVKQYALGRMEQVKCTQIEFAVPANFNARRWMQYSFGRFLTDQKPEAVAVLFRGEAAKWVESRKWHPGSLIKRQADGSLLLAFPVAVGGQRPYENLMRWVLSFGQDATVYQPDELKKMVADEVTAMHQAIQSGVTPVITNY